MERFLEHTPGRKDHPKEVGCKGAINLAGVIFLKVNKKAADSVQGMKTWLEDLLGQKSLRGLLQSCSPRKSGIGHEHSCRGGNFVPSVLWEVCIGHDDHEPVSQLSELRERCEIPRREQSESLASFGFRKHSVTQKILPFP